MMKMNWGHGLTIAIAISVSLILTLVFLSTNEKIDLVVDDYYPKELKYENEMIKLRNSAQLAKGLKVDVNETVEISFPAIVEHPVQIKGTVWFYRPSDRSLDLQDSIRLGADFKLSYSLQQFTNGKYEIIIDWQAKGTDYLHKEVVFFNHDY
jgi:hypothetical protein